VFRVDPAMTGMTEIKTISDATKRVSSVVAGDPAYIITVDGARYFPGAIMPSGHRLVAIQEQTVVLERNGHQIRIKF
jgi:type III secretion protein D